MRISSVVAAVLAVLPSAGQAQLADATGPSLTEQLARVAEGQGFAVDRQGLADGKFDVTVNGQRITVEPRQFGDFPASVVMHSIVNGRFTPKFGGSLPFTEELNYTYISALHHWSVRSQIKLPDDPQAARSRFVDGLNAEAGYAIAFRKKLAAALPPLRK